MKTKKIFPVILMLVVILAAGCDEDDNNGIRPQVDSTEPANEAENVDISTLITANFSAKMEPSTINSETFTLSHGNLPVSGEVTYSGTKATFTPTNPLVLDTEYEATITNGAKSLEGNPLTGSITWGFKTFAPGSGPETVDLKAAENYVILSKSAISNSSISDITGDLGLSPAATSYITGFTLTNETEYATSAQVSGRIYAADMAAPTSTNLTIAVENMASAYDDAAGRTSPHFLELGTGNIGGKTLVAGLYKWSNTVTLPSNIIISGDDSDVWIFQVAGDLSLGNGVNVILSGGAQAKNIFWQVAGTVTLGTDSHFEGIILSMTGITLQTGATFNGRALAQTAVVLDNNVIVQP